MAILVNRDIRVLIQGITGKSGREVTSELLDYQTRVVAGVTPGKGGQVVDTVPVFDKISDAIREVGPIDVSMVYVPPLLAFGAAMEAIDAGIPLIHIFTERMPVFDVSCVLSRAQTKKIKVLGPSSVGAISPGEVKIGSIGGSCCDLVFSKGPIGIISRSGGMCSELAMLITDSGFGQSTVVGIGGDLLIGTTFSDLLLEFEQDIQTKAVVIFGEVGGSCEIGAAKLLKEGKYTKPLVVFMAGKFAESLPKDTALGHAGAIVGLESTMDEKIRILKESGAIVCENFEDIPKVIRKVIG